MTSEQAIDLPEREPVFPILSVVKVMMEGAKRSLPPGWVLWL